MAIGLLVVSYLGEKDHLSQLAYQIYYEPLQKHISGRLSSLRRLTNQMWAHTCDILIVVDDNAQ